MSRVAKYVVDAQALEDAPLTNLWRVVSKKDPHAIDVFDRHYSRQTLGGEVGPPGRKLVFITRNGQALWCSHYPDPMMAMDHLDSYRCVVFRNESNYQSSLLIRHAVIATETIWGPPPRDGWVTWVDTSKVNSRNPGYCYKKAGWRLDREWKHRKLVRLRYP